MQEGRGLSGPSVSGTSSVTTVGVTIQRSPGLSLCGMSSHHHRLSWDQRAGFPDPEGFPQDERQCSHRESLRPSGMGWSRCSEQGELPPSLETLGGLLPAPRPLPACGPRELNDSEMNRKVRGFPFLQNSSDSEPWKCHSFPIKRRRKLFSSLSVPAAEPAGNGVVSKHSPEEAFQASSDLSHLC